MQRVEEFRSCIFFSDKRFDLDSSQRLSRGNCDQ